MVPAACPKSLLVMGSGAIGIEFASFYRALGAEVTVVEALPRILPVEDEEVSARRRRRSRSADQVPRRRQGHRARQEAATASRSRSRPAARERLEAERAIVAVGIAANVEDMGLEALGLKLERGHVVVDAHGATNVKGLYAIGDVAGPPWLAHKAMHEGVHCVETDRRPERAHRLARADPRLHLFAAADRLGGPHRGRGQGDGLEVKVGRFPFRANGKAIAAGETEGFVKTVFDAKTGALVGAHMIGGEVTEMIQGFALAMTLESDRGGTLGHRLPPPDHERGDARGLARRLRPRAGDITIPSPVREKEAPRDSPPHPP